MTTLLRLLFLCAAAAFSAASPRAALRDLESLYTTHVLPLERGYSFESFPSLGGSPPLQPAHFNASKPLILLVGPYSAGKTTLIKHLLGRPFPGARIGPEPTTDGFTLLQHGRRDGEQNGRAFIQGDHRFGPVAALGASFLGSFRAARCNASFLVDYDFVDTPGTLANGSNGVDRGFSMEKALKWFADEAAMIILMFDVNKVDLTEEMVGALHALEGNYAKVRVVLNKAQTVPMPELTRVYGALMWGLGRAFPRTEAPRVYITSFPDTPAHEAAIAAADAPLGGLLAREAAELREDIQRLPGQVLSNLLGQVMKRKEAVLRFAWLVEEVKKGKAWLWGGDAPALAQGALEEAFKRAARAHGIPERDIPTPAEFLAAWGAASPNLGDLQPAGTGLFRGSAKQLEESEEALQAGLFRLQATLSMAERDG
jgi:EH domain-containing protein 1